ncbi:Phospholipase A-2-activating protein [Mycena kentingensis (nom. inval.)]|nr:Phospholipase A-2-activating protein [Mycena kentingensis (nom. inval.)]
MMPYKLSATPPATPWMHVQPVPDLGIRTNEHPGSLAAPADDLILSASRDSTAIVTRFVNAVAYLPPTPEAPKGYAVTGDQDGIINVYSLDPAKDDPKYTLLGHSANICGLRTTPGGQIVSCSWDATARVWKDFAQLYELKGHENSVWDALAVSEDEFITGSADKTIKVWKQNKVVHSFNPHNGVVRSLAYIPNIGFASCADNEIKLAVLPSGDLVSSSEDRSVRVWKDGECAQVLVHPAISVWAVATLPNGDIVSGASDKNIRIFSSTPERWASDGDLQAYDDVLSQQSLAAHEVDKVKVEGADALNQPGSRVGQTLLVSKGDATQVYQWDGSEWQLLGERAKAPANTGAKSKDGEPALKLPYNVSENPAAAAANFLERNGLPLSHVNTVVEFIYQNTAGETLGGGGGEDYGDPFTATGKHKRVGVLRSIHGRVTVPKLRPFRLDSVIQHGLLRPFHRRVAVLWRSSIRRVAGVKEKLFAAPFKAAEWRADNFPSPNKVQEMNAMLASRAADGAGDGYGGWLSRILGVIRTVGYEKLSAAQKKPRATMLLNVSCLSLFTSFVPALRHTYVAPIANVPDTEGAGGDAESVYRALVGLGNIVYASKQHGRPLSGEAAALVGRCIRELPGRWAGEEQVKSVVVEIGAWLVSGVSYVMQEAAGAADGAGDGAEEAEGGDVVERILPIALHAPRPGAAARPRMRRESSLAETEIAFVLYRAFVLPVVQRIYSLGSPAQLTAQAQVLIPMVGGRMSFTPHSSRRRARKSISVLVYGCHATRKLTKSVSVPILRPSTDGLHHYVSVGDILEHQHLQPRLHEIWVTVHYKNVKGGTKSARFRVVYQVHPALRPNAPLGVIGEIAVAHVGQCWSPIHLRNAQYSLANFVVDSVRGDIRQAQEEQQDPESVPHCVLSMPGNYIPRWATPSYN